jgi:hypothetical protein
MDYEFAKPQKADALEPSEVALVARSFFIDFLHDLGC